jgi:hypothetical protein
MFVSRQFHFLAGGRRSKAPIGPVMAPEFRRRGKLRGREGAKLTVFETEGSAF